MEKMRDYSEIIGNAAGYPEDKHRAVYKHTYDNYSDLLEGAVNKVQNQFQNKEQAAKHVASVFKNHFDSWHKKNNPNSNENDGYYGAASTINFNRKGSMKKTAFWEGFTKTAKVYPSIMNALGAKQVSQKLLTGSEFAAKQQGLLAAHRAAKASQKATQVLQSNPAQQFAAKAKTIAQNKVNQAGTLSAHAQNNIKNLNAGRNYRPEQVADLAR